MARQVVGNPFEGQIPTVGPTAAPVDTYVRGVVKRSPFEALSETLSSLERKAVPALQREEQRRAANEFAQGQELYNKTRTSMGDAVKAGLIAEGESPYLRKGYRISNLNSLSARYASDLSNALTTQKLYTNGNPASIDAFTKKFYADFEKKNGITDGFTPTETATHFSEPALKANEAFRASWREKNVAWQADQQYNALSNEISTFTFSHFSPSDTPEQRATKSASLSVWVMKRVAQAQADGMDKTKLNKTIVDSVVLAAYEQEDPSILNLLDSIIVGKGPVGGSVAARQARIKASSDISTIIAAKEVAAGKARDAANEQAMNDSTSEALQASFALRANPNNAQADEAWNAAIVNLNKINTTESLNMARTMTSFRDTMVSEGIKESPADDIIYGAIHRQVLDQPDRQSALAVIENGLKDGEISASDSNTLISSWQSIVGREREGSLDFDNSTTGIPGIMRGFKQQIAQNDLDKIMGDEAIQVFNAEIAFKSDYLEQLDRWKRENPDKTIDIRTKQEIAYEVVKRLQPIHVGQENIDKANNSLVKLKDDNARLAEALRLANRSEAEKAADFEKALKDAEGGGANADTGKGSPLPRIFK